LEKGNRRIFATRASPLEKRGIEMLIFIDCTRRLCEKTVTKKNLARQALFSVHTKTFGRHSEPFGSLRPALSLSKK
jgi:hypothetical protein